MVRPPFGISHMRKFFSLGLALLSFYQTAQGDQRSTHSVRLGDLQVTAIATRIASIQDLQHNGLRPRDGYQIVFVLLRVKNVARYPNCSDLDVWLSVKQGYQYPKSFGFGNPPRTSTLPPADESSGEIAFEVKIGTEPYSLKLVRNAIGDDLCATSQHRDTRISGPDSVSLSLLGLPSNTEQSVPGNK